MVVEIAFGHLKSRWRRLNKQSDMFVTTVPNVAACCGLHDLCEIHCDTFNDEQLQDIEAEDSVEGSKHPTTTTITGSEDSEEIRDALMHYLVYNPL